MNQAAQKVSKILLLLVGALVFRLLPFRAPNVEPITASLMPIAKSYGKILGIFFAVGSVLVYDSITGTLGVHTIFTAGSFAALALLADVYFRNREATRGNFVRFAIASTILYDAVTGLVPGPIFFDQSFSVALAGQVPFTALHLLGNIVFAATLSPAIYHFLIRKREESKEQTFISIFKPKQI